MAFSRKFSPFTSDQTRYGLDYADSDQYKAASRLHFTFPTRS